MITVKKDGQQAKELTVEELVDGIGASLEKTSGVIGTDRQHSIDSHLRTCMRTLGYKPREIKDTAGKVVTGLPELFNQFKACIAAGGEITQAQHDHLHIHLKATNSNCAAEVGMKSAPELKEAPAGGTSQQQKSQEPTPLGELMAMKYPDLLKLVESINAEEGRTEKITLPQNSSKIAVAEAILKAKGQAAK